ncbi:MAG: hypothetical protein K1X29_07975 [Bdellovibrionales bacterium]|nr:hypothetical protein [Bdellovibrionales bacterium]
MEFYEVKPRDVTTLHFESFSEDELRRLGFSKNCRFKETQVVLALQTAQGGIPVGYELYQEWNKVKSYRLGDTYEGKTLTCCGSKPQRKV